MMTIFLKRHSLAMGLILMFLFTWPIDLSNAGVFPFQVPFFVYIFLGWGFIVASLLMTWLTQGRAGVKGLLKRYLIWRVDWKWYLAAFFLVPALNYFAILVNAWITKTPIDYGSALAYDMFGPSVNLALIIVPFFLFDAIANGEEMGWRGYVLPRLQARYSALTASLILAVLWSFWHVPKFVAHWNNITFFWFVVDEVAKAILMTWMYNNTRGSLLLVTLFHASFNTAGVLLPMANSDADMNLRAIISLWELFAAIIVMLYTGAERLSRSEPKQVHEEDIPMPQRAVLAE